MLAVAITVSGTALGSDVQPPAGTTTVFTDTMPVPADPAPAAEPVPPVIPVVVPVMTPQPALQALKKAALRHTQNKVHLYIKSARHWQALMGLRLSKASRLVDNTASIAYVRWSLKKWQSLSRRLHARARTWMAKRVQVYEQSVRQWSQSMGRPIPKRQLAGGGSIEASFNHWRRTAGQVYSAYLNPPQKSNFECIHGYEGSWTDEDSGHNGHYGGVQMGKAEWDIYGRPYTHVEYPYQASKLDQLWAAYRYYRVSGFGPWPQTRLDCGL